MVIWMLGGVPEVFMDAIPMVCYYRTIAMIMCSGSIMIYMAPLST